MSLATRVVVVDIEQGMTVGPFESKEVAEGYFKAIAEAEEWAGVLDTIERTGSAFVDPIIEPDGLACMAIEVPLPQFMPKD